MTDLLPVLKLFKDDGTCVEIANNCRTLAYIRQSRINATGWEALSDCDDCCPDCIDNPDGYFKPSIDRAFWTLGGQDAGDEFFGMLFDRIKLEPATSVRRRGESAAEAPTYSPRRLELTGTLVTNTRRAASLGRRSIEEQLAQCGGDGFMAELFTHCPPASQPTVPFLQQWEEPLEETLVADVSEGCDPCGLVDPAFTPTPLPVRPASPASIDSGRRTILRLRPQYFDDFDDGEFTHPCQGVPVIMVFEVLDDELYGDPISIPFLEDVAIPDLAECRPFDWWSCFRTDFTGAEACAIDPLDDPDNLLEDPDAGSDVALVTREQAVLYRHTRSRMIPQLPTTADGRISMKITAGDQPLRNLQIDFHPAHVGAPDPATCRGEAVYAAMRPCQAMRVAYIPAGGVMRLDGPTGRVTVECNGEETSGEHLVSGWGNPLWSPSCRYWAIARFDCLNTGPGVSVAMNVEPEYTG